MEEEKQNPKSAAHDPVPPAANDAEAPGEPAGDEIAALGAALKAKEEELAAFRDSALRQLAEAQNQKRRAENDAAEARRFGAAALARDILTVADNLRRALDAAAASSAIETATQIEALRQGVEMTERELANVLQRHGVKRHDPAGERFDPNLHQAMFEVESADAAPGTVVQVLQAAYLLHDRLLRPALVGVARAKTENAAGAAEAGSGEGLA